MSWISTLNDTYEYLWDFNSRNPGEVRGLIPPGIIMQNAHVEVILSREGEFLRAAKISDKKDSPTPIPATEKSAARTLKPVPHAIFDNLLYVAGDIERYIPKKKENQDLYNNNFIPYLNGVSAWAKHSNNIFVNIVYKYTSKETLAQDLISEGILILNSEGYIDENVKMHNTEQCKFLIRFAVEMDGRLYKLWEDDYFISDYTQYYLGTLPHGSEEFCYATGKPGYMAELHGKNIRYAGDGAKLISSNDTSNYTYRGLFNTPDKAVRISYEASEKAHSALRWLIRNQGYIRNGYTVVAWTAGTDKIIQPMTDTKDLFDAILDGSFDFDSLDSAEDFAIELKKALSGYMHSLDSSKTINIMALDAATPGRMSILYYGEKQVDDYLESIEKWHHEAAWNHLYKRKKEEINGKTINKAYRFIGAPAPIDIILCAFGTEQGGILKIGERDKFVNQQLGRLLPCITEGAKLPVDFMKGAFRNAISPQSRKESWQMCLTVACSLIRKYYIDRKGVEYVMALNNNLDDRSYLYGRLLAIADKLESDALIKKGINRETTAMRYMEALSKRPYRTWKNIEISLQPYWRMLESKAVIYYKKILNEVMDLFKLEDFKNNHQLEPLYLLGYHCQSSAFYKSSLKKEEVEVND